MENSDKTKLLYFEAIVSMVWDKKSVFVSVEINEKKPAKNSQSEVKMAWACRIWKLGNETQTMFGLTDKLLQIIAKPKQTWHPLKMKNEISFLDCSCNLVSLWKKCNWKVPWDIAEQSNLSVFVKQDHSYYLRLTWWLLT